MRDNYILFQENISKSSAPSRIFILKIIVEAIAQIIYGPIFIIGCSKNKNEYRPKGPSRFFNPTLAFCKKSVIKLMRIVPPPINHKIS